MILMFQVNTDALKDEIQEIEEMIKRAYLQLEVEKSRLKAHNHRKDQLQLRSDLQQQCENLEKEALKAEKTWTMMRRMSVWELAGVNEEETVLSYVGSCSESCATVRFQLDRSGILVSTATNNPTLFKYKGRQVPLPSSIHHFWSFHNEALCSAISVAGRETPATQKKVLRSNAWTRCRLEAICSELGVLHRRYNASIKAITKESKVTNFSVHVKFSRAGSNVALHASFELNKSYPHGSLNTQIEQLQERDNSKDSINLERLKEVLAKNAKPGFFYLSRTFAVLSAYYHQAVVIGAYDSQS